MQQRELQNFTKQLESIVESFKHMEGILRVNFTEHDEEVIKGKKPGREGEEKSKDNKR